MPISMVSGQVVAAGHYPGGSAERRERGVGIGEGGATAVTVNVSVLPRGQRYGTHTHPVHQLAWASEGKLIVQIEEVSWVASPTLAIWVPAGYPHSTTAATDTTMWGVYADPRFNTLPYEVPTPVAVTPHAQELLRQLHATVEPLAQLKAESALFEELSGRAVRPIVRLPVDVRAAQVARELVARPDDERSLASWAQSVGVSERTLSRLFASETGVSFSEWRTAVRMRASLDRLAEGMTVSAVARKVGYRTSSAFVYAFRKTFGQTPSRYFRSGAKPALAPQLAALSQEVAEAL